MYCGKITFGVRGTSKCQHVHWAVRARGSPSSPPFGSCWAAVYPARGVTDTAGSFLRREICLCLPLCSACYLWNVSLSQFSLLNRQNLIWQQWLAAVLTGSRRPQQKLLLVTKKTEGERNGATSLVGVSGYSCSCVKLKSMEETFLYKETQNSSVLGFGTVPFSEVTMQD